jgi:hypothetical protein
VAESYRVLSESDDYDIEYINDDDDEEEEEEEEEEEYVNDDDASGVLEIKACSELETYQIILNELIEKRILLEKELFKYTEIIEQQNKHIQKLRSQNVIQNGTFFADELDKLISKTLPEFCPKIILI